MSGEFPRRVVIPEHLQAASDPILRTAPLEEADRVRDALLADLRAQIIERGWDPADVEVTLRMSDSDADLFIRNQFRVVAEARWRPRERTDQPIEGDPS